MKKNILHLLGCAMAMLSTAPAKVALFLLTFATVTSNSHAVVTDTTTSLMTDAGSYFGFLSANALTLAGLIIGISLIIAVTVMIKSWLGNAGRKS